MVPVGVQLVEENLPSVLYREQIPEHNEIRSKKDVNVFRVQLIDNTLEEVHEYEEIGRRFKINGYDYYLISESKTEHKYYLCIKSRCAIRCRGSITISPNNKIVKKVEHSCITSINDNHLYTTNYGKTERKLRGNNIKIAGNFYHFCREYKTKNKYYLCAKRIKVKCRGTITISPEGQLIRRVEHTCNKTFHETNLTEIDTANDSSTPKGSIDKGRDHSRSSVSKLVKIEEIQEENTTTGSITSTPSQLQVHSMEIDNQDSGEIQAASKNSSWTPLCRRSYSCQKV